MIALKSLVQQLEAQIPNAAVTNASVTTSTVGWQIEHALLTINQIITTVAASNPTDYKWSFNLMRTVVFFRAMWSKIVGFFFDVLDEICKIK